MGLFDTIKTKMNDPKVKAQIEQLKEKNKNGELTDKGKELFGKFRQHIKK